MFLFIGLFSIVNICNTAFAAWTILSAGDVVIVTANATAPDAFEFVPRVELNTGTKIYFSDNAWSGDNTRRLNEWAIIFTTSKLVPAGKALMITGADSASIALLPDSSRGTVVRTGAGGFDLATAWDNILVYQWNSYNDVSPSFIYGVWFTATTPRIITGAPTANNSYVPPALSSWTTALNYNTLPSVNKNIQYWCSNLAMRSSNFLSTISNNIYWAGSASRYPIIACTFDAVIPTLSFVHIASNNIHSNYAKIGDTITLSFTWSESLTWVSWVIAWHAVAISGTGTNRSGTYTMVTGDTEWAISLSINYRDIVGNPWTSVSTTTDSSSVVFDKTAPAAPVFTTLDQTTSGSNITLVGTAESGARVDVYSWATLVASWNSNSTFSISVTLSNEWANVFTAKASDQAGNTSSTSATVTIIKDTTVPTLAEITSIPTPSSNTTPNYTFSSNETGSISYWWSCSSPTTTASPSNNTITLNALSEWTYSDCTITVTDMMWNPSAPLSISSFTIDLTTPLVVEITPVPSPTNNTTPDYTFTTDEAWGTVVYGGDCSSATSIAVSWANTITFNALSEWTHNNCVIMVIDGVWNTGTLNVSSFTIDTIAPTISEITPVPTPSNDTTPNYTFSSNETGSISYWWSCSSSTTTASSGNNTITLDPLGAGTYTTCTIIVTDAASNSSNTLILSSFTIDTAVPAISEITPVPTPTSDTTPDYTFTTDKAGTISYWWSCSSLTNAAVTGNNTITLNTLAQWTYNDCTITITDWLGNTSNILTLSSFTIAISSWGDGWWGTTLQADNCPNGDYSSSYYDGTCGTTETHDSALVSWGINDVSSWNDYDSLYSNELNQAYLFAFENGITTQKTIQRANIEGELIRSHMAKMMVNYVIKVLGHTTINTWLVCQFDDMLHESKEMKLYTKYACQLGIMWVEPDWTPAKNFNPNGIVTRAEFWTALSKALYGNIFDGGIPYYKNHLAALKKFSIIKNTTAANKEIRGYAMLMFMRASQK